MPNIEIKNVKYNFNGHGDSHCFTATVYKDGKRWCEANDDGWGGAMSFYPLAGTTNSQLHDEIKEYESTLSKVKFQSGDQEFEFDGSLELVVGDLVNDWLVERDVKNTLKKIAYVKNGGIYTLPAKYKPTESALEQVKKSPWWDDNCILLNTLPMKEVVDLYRKYT